MDKGGVHGWIYLRVVLRFPRSASLRRRPERGFKVHPSLEQKRAKRAVHASFFLLSSSVRTSGTVGDTSAEGLDWKFPVVG